MAMPKLGSGARFKALSDKISKEPSIKDRGIETETIGRAQSGINRMQAMAAVGRKGKK